MTNEEFQSLIIEQLTQMNKKMETIETNISDLKSQTKENTDIINALMHRTEVIGAEVSGLTINTANNKAIERIENNIANLATKQDLSRIILDISYLARKTAEHESDLCLLKLAN